MHKIIPTLAASTWACPTCGAPIFPLMPDQATPKEADALGFSREQIKICYCCMAAHILELQENHKQ